MADLFTVTAPLALRCPNGTRLESDEGASYPGTEQIRAIARRLGAAV